MTTRIGSLSDSGIRCYDGLRTVSYGCSLLAWAALHLERPSRPFTCTDSHSHSAPSLSVPASQLAACEIALRCNDARQLRKWYQHLFSDNCRGMPTRVTKTAARRQHRRQWCSGGRAIGLCAIGSGGGLQQGDALTLLPAARRHVRASVRSGYLENWYLGDLRRGSGRLQSGSVAECHDAHAPRYTFECDI